MGSPMLMDLQSSNKHSVFHVLEESGSLKLFLLHNKEVEKKSNYFTPKWFYLKLDT